MNVPNSKVSEIYSLLETVLFIAVVRLLCLMKNAGAFDWNEESQRWF